MSTVNSSLQIAKYDSAWFAANSTVVLKQGQLVFNETTGELFIGDGVAQLSTLTAINGGSGSGVQSVTGPNVNNGDPTNPVVIPQTILSSPDGLSGIESANSIAALLASDGTNFSRIDVYPTEIQITESSISTNTPLMVNYSKSIKSLTAAVWGNFINSLSLKAIPVNADSIHISDSAASNTAKKLTLTSFKSFLKTYFDTIYTTTSAVATQITTALSGYLSLSGGTLTGLLKQAKSTDIASATTTDLSTATGNLVHITGTTTITSFGTVQAGTTIKVIFDGTLTLTHNATSLILPGSANIITGAGDSALLVSEGGGNWKCMFYEKQDGAYLPYTSTVTGFSSTPPQECTYKMLTKNTYHFNLFLGLAASNATTLTFTTPFNSGNANNIPIPVWVYDNGTGSIGYMQQIAGSNVVNVFKAAGVPFKALGQKSVRLSLVLNA